MNKIKLLLVVLLCILVAGCDGERVEELESQVEYLEGQVESLQRELASQEDETSWEQSLIWCDYCGESVPEYYIFEDSNENVCPKCVYGAYRELLDTRIAKCTHCHEFYWFVDSSGNGLCGVCSEEFGGSCALCGEPTILWEPDMDYVLCEWCLDGIFKDESMQDAVWAWNEG